MDGAIRFTQRDALAAVLITGVNIVAGLIIGVVQHGLDLGDGAPQTYTILTVGEGLVTAIPALLVSMSGGLITTRAASESHLGEEVADAVARASAAAGDRRRRAGRAGADSRACRSSRSSLVAAVLGGAAYANREAPARGAGAPKPRRRRRRRRRVERRRPVDPLSVEVGYALVALVDEKQGGTLLDARARRSAGRSPPRPAWSCRRCTSPTTCSSARAPTRFSSRASRSRAASCSPIGCWRSTPARRRAPLEGTPTREPAFGLPALWIRAEQRDRAIGRRLHRRRSDDGAVDASVGDRSATFLPDLLTPPADQGDGRSRRADVAEAGRGARAEAASARRHPARAAAAAARARAGPRPDDDSRGDGRCRAGRPKDPDAVERGGARGARAAPSAASTRPSSGELPTISLAPALEERLLQSIVRTEQGAVLALDPTDAQNLASRIARALETRSGTACAFVHASAASAPVATVHAGAAAHRGAVAQRGSPARAGRAGSGSRLTCISSDFAAPPCVTPSHRPEHELGPDALVLSHARSLPAAAGAAGWARARCEITAAVERRRVGIRPTQSGRPTSGRTEPPTSVPAQPDGDRPRSRDRRRRRAARLGLDAPSPSASPGVPRLQRRDGSLAALDALSPPSSRSVAAGDEPTRRSRCSSARPGAGKTTTIAKIAAQERARRGRTLESARRRRLPRRRGRAAAPLRRHHRRAVSRRAHAGELDERSIGPRAAPVLVDTAGRSAATIARASSSSMLAEPPRRAHASGAAGRRRRVPRPARRCSTPMRARGPPRRAHQARRSRLGVAAGARPARARLAGLVSRHRPARARRSRARDAGELAAHALARRRSAPRGSA